MTIGSCFGLAQRLLYVTIDADVECKWRERVGWLTTSSGSFARTPGLQRTHSFRLFNQTAQVWCPIETRYETHYDRVPDAIHVTYQP
jgi:hypothetical protein